jgi:DNA-binding transcriptional regulator YiaG
MTPERMREIRERMHLPVRSLARWADISETSIRQMEAGQRSIPAAFATWIDALGRWQKKFPPPEKTR